MLNQFNQIFCPKCKGTTWKFGKDPHTGLQKFRCKNPSCRHQFIPAKPKSPKKQPKISCPTCGSPMHIFKYLSDGIRFRCNNHLRKDHRRCNHKINLPLPGKSFKIASDPLQSINHQIPIPFSWNKMNFSKSSVSLALYFAVFKALPAPDVVDIMKTIFNVKISHDTITRWTHKASLNLHKNLGPLKVPYSKNKRLFVDETLFTVRGQKRWVWAAKDSKFDSLQSWYLSLLDALPNMPETSLISLSPTPLLSGKLLSSLMDYGVTPLLSAILTLTSTINISAISDGIMTPLKI